MNVSEILGSYPQKSSMLGDMRLIFRKSRSLSAKSPISFLISSFFFFSPEISRGCRRWHAAVAAACGGACGCGRRQCASMRPVAVRGGARSGACGANDIAAWRCAAALCGGRGIGRRRCAGRGRWSARGGTGRGAVARNGAVRGSPGCDSRCWVWGWRRGGDCGSARGCHGGGRWCRAGHCRRRSQQCTRRPRLQAAAPCGVLPAARCDAMPWRGRRRDAVRWRGR